MGRIARQFVVEEGSTNHCTWRSHGGALVLESDEAREKFLSLLKKYKEKFAILIYSYTLMGTHPHVVTNSPRGQRAFSAFWKCVNYGFACWYNKRTQGRGQVVRDRMRSPQIQDGRHLLTVMAYCDLNPVRAGIARKRGDWKWSSYRHYAFGEVDELITDAPEYLALGSTPAARRIAYRTLGDPLAEQLHERRRDLVEVPFIGEESWVEQRLDACRVPPPG